MDMKLEEPQAFDAVSIGLGVAAAAVNGDRSGMMLLLDPLEIEQVRAVTRVSSEALAAVLQVYVPEGTLPEALELVRTMALGRAAGGGFND